MELEIAKHTDRTYSVQMPIGQECIGCHVIVDVTGSPQKAHLDERRTKAAFSRAKELAHELIAAIEAWERRDAERS
jgi:hypothetical protein